MSIKPVQRKLGFLLRVYFFCCNYIFCRHRNTAIHWFLAFNTIKDRLLAAEDSKCCSAVMVNSSHALCEVKRCIIHIKIPYNRALPPSRPLKFHCMYQINSRLCILWHYHQKQVLYKSWRESMRASVWQYFHSHAPELHVFSTRRLQPIATCHVSCPQLILSQNAGMSSGLSVWCLFLFK